MLTLSVVSGCYAGDTPTQQQLEDWFNDDSEFKAAEVNEGKLAFITSPDKSVLHSSNVLTITAESIDSGWVSMSQCYRHLDAVPEAQVVYQYRFIRDIHIVSSKGIGKAWVDGQSIQLQNVTRQAELCTAAQVRVFYQRKDKTFILVNGPFQRRFLDGYYPMHVTLEVHYPQSKLVFAGAIPDDKDGMKIQKSDNRLLVDVYFEGKLNTEFRFRERL